MENTVGGARAPALPRVLPGNAAALPQRVVCVPAAEDLPMGRRGVRQSANSTHGIDASPRASLAIDVLQVVTHAVFRDA